MTNGHDEVPERGLPVRLDVTGSDGDDPKKPMEGIALCLSGGGYRAMIFHLGAVWRLNEAGYLPKLSRVSSVSGGSITAAVLGRGWGALHFDRSGVATNFDAVVVQPLRRLAARTIDEGSIVGGLLMPGSISDKVADAYRKNLFGHATLQDLPDVPRFVINATNVQTGVLFRFSKPYLADYRVGRVPEPKVELAVAVAASSAFPPVLSPVRLDFDRASWAEPSGQESEDLHCEPYMTHVVLSDGGVYDNLGLETAWKKYRTVLVSDGGGKMQPEGEPKGDWARHAIRVSEIVDNQVRALRKRQLIASYKAGEAGGALRRDGAYWGIRSNIEKYKTPGALPCPVERTTDLANLKTRLKRLDREVLERLINWGYAICDAAMRRHVDSSLAAPQGFPYPSVGIG